jgi:3-deoxy-D-manno-octulosonic-acid transferase
MRRLYSCLLFLAVPLALALVLWRGFRERLYWAGLAERFGGGTRLASESIWVHAVSMGEMNAAAPLVNGLRARYPELPLVLTTATPAGRARALALFGAAADVRYLPYDTRGSMRRFLERVRPRAAVIMETELWPNLFTECAARKLPLLLANARLSARSVSSYQRFSQLFRALFAPNVSVAAQTKIDAERFVAIGASPAKTQVVGNVKFDVEFDPDLKVRGQALRGKLGAHRPIWVAGSTHQGEEEQLLKAHSVLRESHPQALLILVPRHKARFDEVAQLLAREGVPFRRRSLGEEVARDTEVLLGDTLGELNLLYACADLAFVGGSLVPVGGHNLLEPAMLGVPVLSGESLHNTREVAELLLARGAALRVSDAQGLAAELARLLSDPGERERMGLAGQALISENRGSSERLLALISPCLAARPSAAR